MFQTEVVQKIKTILYSIIFFENHAVCDMTDVNMAMRIACWIPKTTNSEYVILIVVPLQYCGTNALSSALYVHCLVLYNLETACLFRGTN
jgi:hypothetical protein